MDLIFVIEVDAILEFLANFISGLSPDSLASAIGDV